MNLIHDGKIVNRRLLLRKARAITIFVIIPLAFVSAVPPYSVYSVLVALLGSIIPVIGLKRSRKSLKNLGVALSDLFVIILTDFFIFTSVMITGGDRITLLALFLVPLVFFTAEFGVKVGIFNLIPFGLFVVINILLYKQLPPAFWPRLSVLLILSLVLLSTFRSNIETEIRYQQKINRILNQDELTGLFNRRFLKFEMRQAIKRHMQFALIIIDINYFKYYNDHWGHPRGDSLLIQISRILKEAVTEGDRVIRYSGDEFIIFSPIHDGAQRREQPSKIIEAVNFKIEDTHFPGAECFPHQKLTLAYGTVLYPDEASSCEDLIAIADRVLYQNKRNR